jgi:hypothetical protein
VSSWRPTVHEVFGLGLCGSGRVRTGLDRVAFDGLSTTTSRCSMVASMSTTVCRRTFAAAQAVATAMRCVGHQGYNYCLTPVTGHGHGPGARISGVLKCCFFTYETIAPTPGTSAPGLGAIVLYVKRINISGPHPVSGRAQDRGQMQSFHISGHVCQQRC